MSISNRSFIEKFERGDRIMRKSSYPGLYFRIGHWCIHRSGWECCYPGAESWEVLTIPSGITFYRHCTMECPVVFRLSKVCGICRPLG
jgi:hypothetical protein